MKRHLSRKQFLSFGVWSGLGLFATRCTLDDSAGTTSSGAAGTTGTNGASGSTGSSSGGATGSSTTTTGNGGSLGSGGTGGSPSGSGGTGGAGGGSGGRGGSTGSGGSAGSGGRGGSGGAGGSKDGGAGGPDGGAMCTGMLTANISMNHAGMEHVLTIPAADIVAGVAKVYATSGATQNHMHYVQLTAADFTTLQTGGVVTKHSCNGGDHQYAIKCGTPPAAGNQMCTATDNCGMTMSGATGPCM